MIWFTLSLLSLAIFAEADEGDPYLVYAVECPNNKSTMLYGIDFELSEPKYFLNLTNKGKQSDKKLENIFLGEGHVYLSFEKSNVVGRYNMANEKYVEKLVDTYTLVGLGPKNALYMFDSNERRFIVYKFGGATSELKSSEKLKQANKKMPSIDVDPRDNRRYIFYAYCKANSTPVGKVFDVTKDTIIPNYNQKLAKCFDMWRITPNGMQAFAVKTKTIYFSSEEGGPFEEYYSADSVIAAFAVGNRELFYAARNDLKKIIKIESECDEKGKKAKELTVGGHVIAMALRQPSIFTTDPVLETES